MVTQRPALTRQHAVARGGLCAGGSFSLLKAAGGRAGESLSCCHCLLDPLKLGPLPRAEKAQAGVGVGGGECGGRVADARALSATAPPSAESLTLLSRAEPIQSRCAVLRYTKLSDAQVLARLMTVIEQEKVPYTDDGLEAVIFTAQGDLRQVCATTATPWAPCPSFWGRTRGVTAAQTGCGPHTPLGPGAEGGKILEVGGAGGSLQGGGRTANLRPRRRSSTGAEQLAVNFLRIRLHQQ